MKIKVTILLLITMSVAGLRANNIAVANVTLTDQVPTSHYCNVKFDLSWDNSWRTTSTPENWDAAWIFVKYRVSGGVWHHAKLSPTAGDHTPATGSVITPSADSVGVFIYRSASGSGTNTWTNLKIRWLYGVNGLADDASVEVKVFSVEMVYIPQGSFYLGDGNGIFESEAALHPAASDNTSFLLNTTSVQVQVDQINNFDDFYLWGFSGCTLSIDGDGGIITTGSPSPQTNPNFPTGYSAFYLMKYEASQEEYVDFLNTLTRTQQQKRVGATISGSSPSNPFVMSNTSSVSYRNGIRCPADISGSSPITFFCDYNSNATGNEAGDGQNIACNWVGWPDLSAYADWTGLRPMTELEFEKAARGKNYPVLNEWAWGSTNLSVTTYTISNAGQPSESFTNCGAGTGNAIDLDLFPTGPGRCGIFAASATNKVRQETGAGYYGNMELSGNLWEFAVTIGNVAGRSYTGLHGNGELNSSGDANVNYWPGINGNSNRSTANNVYGGTTGVTGWAGGGGRGGDLHSIEYMFLFTSDRYTYLSSNTRNYYQGIRACRTAP